MLNYDETCGVGEAYEHICTYTYLIWTGQMLNSFSFWRLNIKVLFLMYLW